MHLNWLLAPLLILSLGLSTLSVRDAGAASFERPVSGLVTRVYTHSRTVYLGSEKFHVPDDVYDLSELPVGANVIITFERFGGRLLATSLEVDTKTN